MARTSNEPRPSVSARYRKNPEKEQAGDDPSDPSEQPPETLAEEKLAPEDAFVHSTMQVTDWVLRNRVMLGAIAGVGLLVAAGLTWRHSSQVEREGQVAAEVAKAVAKMPGANPFAMPGQAPGGDDKASYQAAATELERLAKENPGLANGGIAQLYAGYSRLQAGDSAEAVRLFQEALPQSKEPVLKYFAMDGLAAAHSQAGNDEAAIGTLKEMTTSLTGVWQESALVDLGRALEGAGKKDDAIATYERILKDFQFSAFATDARERLTILKPDSAALAAPPAPPAEAPAGE